MNRKFLIVLVAIASCNTESRDENLVSTDTLMRDINVLASDSFLGRKPFTRGEELTVDYLTQRFSAIGAVPGNGNSYVQDVPMVEITPTADTIMTIDAGGKKLSLKAPGEYFVGTSRTQEKISVTNAPIVFAGYGVVAPEYNWNDYEGLDVKGKLVLVMVNDPGFWNGDTTLFKGRAMTYYGRWTYKFEEAARQGAAGVLVIHRTAAAGYPFQVVQNGFNSAGLELDRRGNERAECDMVGWITDTAATKLFKAAGYDESLFEKANARGFKPVDLKMNASTSMRVSWKYNVSKNVIAKIEGTERPDEVIIYTAHWDHLGIGTPDETGDSIYNGALDNATGTAGLLELARAFATSPVKPKRSVVFLAVTGEEQGLLGSAYYTQNPVYPVEKTVGNINMDVLNNYGITKDLFVVGLGQSELEDYLNEVLTAKGGYIIGEARPETGSYYRSDHFNFAKVGIPALYAGAGIDLEDKGKEEGQKIRDEYTSKNYHRPSDEVDGQKWNLNGAARDLQCLFEVGQKLAATDTWPRWKEGSEFRAVREKQNVK